MSPPTADDVRHAGDLKARLVHFALADPELRDGLREAVRGREPTSGAVPRDMAEPWVEDDYLLSHRLPDGRTPVERFADEAPDLSSADRALLRRWADVVLGIFEVAAIGYEPVPVLELRNVIDELRYRAYSWNGPDAFRDVRSGGFCLARLIPLGDDWAVTGPVAFLPAALRHRALTLAATWARDRPGLVLRNPQYLQKAWDMQRTLHRAFVAFFGTDLVVLPGRAVGDRLRAFWRFYVEEFRPDGRRTPAERMRERGIHLPEVYPGVPPELRASAAVGVLCDPRAGFCVFKDFAEVYHGLLHPEVAGEEPYRTRILDYLEDPSVCPELFRRLAREHPDLVGRALAGALDRPGFDWARDGEALLREFKGRAAEEEPRPTSVPVPSHLIAYLPHIRASLGRNDPCPCGSGRKFKVCCGR